MSDTEPITDLSQVRWSCEYVIRCEDPVDPSVGWHVIGEVGNDPDPHSRRLYDLHLEVADDGAGGDCSRWLAEMIVERLNGGGSS